MCIFSSICLQCRRPWFISWVGSILWRRDRLLTSVFLGFPCGSVCKEYTCNAGLLGSIPGLGRSPGEGTGYPLQYSGLDSSVDCMVPKSWTRLSDIHSPSKYDPLYFHCLMNNEQTQEIFVSENS